MAMATNDRTVWTCSLDTSGAAPAATLKVAINSQAASAVKLRGVVYSPCPINGSNKDGPALGDFFWDTFSGRGYEIKGWDTLWARDLSNIRGLGVNTIRVYSMLSRQLNPVDGTYPIPWDSKQLFTHQKFLDACWNGGNSPLYVLVGLPLPDTMYWLDKYRQPMAGQI